MHLSRHRISFALIALCGALVTASAESGSRVSGTWLVAVDGPVKTRCTATLSDTAGALAGTVSCREAGVELRINGAAQGELASGSVPGGVSWTASRDGAGLVGTYQSPQGSCTWSARRAPGGG